jgi:exodeoxyribonuclease VII large subunit
LRQRPVLAQPLRGIEERHNDIDRLRQAARRDIQRTLDAGIVAVRHLRDQLATLGPAATLARGYAVVQRVSGPDDAHVVRAVADAPPGSQLRIRVADGSITAASLGAQAHKENSGG